MEDAPKPLESVAIVLPNWIGDVVMATPALRAVRLEFPQAHIIGLMRPYVAEVLAGTSWLDETLLYSPHGDPGLSRRRLVRELRGRHLDCLISFPNSLSTGLIAWFSGARRRVGYARYGRRFLLTDALPPMREGRKLAPVSAVDNYLRLAARIGCQSLSQQMELAVTPRESSLAGAVWEKLGLAGAMRVVALNAGGAYGAAKRWPVHHCATLAGRAAKRFDAKVLVLCGPKERNEAAEIAANAGSPNVVSLADEDLSIGLSKGCIARSDLVITTDSGPRHIAAALGKPTISLFGPTDPRWADNYSQLDEQLAISLECSPCAKRTCPLGHHRCMNDLTPALVLKAVERVLCAQRTEAA